MRLGALCCIVVIAVACGGSTNGTSASGTTKKDGGATTSVPPGTAPPGTPTNPDGTVFVPGAPIPPSPPGQWSWIPFPDSQCANGTPTGIGVNFGSAKRLLLDLDGGGACWSELTCYQIMTATDLDGYDETKFRQRLTKDTSKSPFNRDDPDNGFRDYNFVYVPYCTGDVHTGDHEMTYGDKVTKHVGRRNLDTFLKRIVPTFPGLERAIIVGASAGGLGTLANYWRAKGAFGATRLDLIDDSGPPLPVEDNIFISDQATAWDLPGTVPPGCTTCTEPAAVIPYYLQKWPDAHFALLEHDQDEVMSAFFLMDPAKFSQELKKVVASTFTASPSAQAFIIPGKDHPTLLDTTELSGGRTLKSWLNDMMLDGPTWKTVLAQ